MNKEITIDKQIILRFFNRFFKKVVLFWHLIKPINKKFIINQINYEEGNLEFQASRFTGFSQQ